MNEHDPPLWEGSDVQKRLQHPIHKWTAAPLDGMVETLSAVFEAKFTLPRAFSEVAAAEKHMAQLQHNMWVTNSRSAIPSVITRISADASRSPDILSRAGAWNGGLTPACSRWRVFRSARSVRQPYYALQPRATLFFDM
jgi:hypothetical protein